MRVADFITKCTIFVGQTVKGKFKPLGTAFFVGYPIRDGACQYLVTAQHLIATKSDLQLRINLRNGHSQIFDIPSDKWIFHPDVARTVDVAVLRTAVSMLIYDIAQVRLQREMATDEVLTRWDIGIGDEVFFPGLFVHHSGQGQNLPIIRTGTIAAMRDEPIETGAGSISAYLVEARSIGGHSGSPVFVKMLAPRAYQKTSPRPLPLAGERQDYYLLGLIRGHLRAKDSGEYATTDHPKEDLWVNSGIATVIPAQDIWDTLSQPELEEERMEAWKSNRKESAAALD